MTLASDRMTKIAEHFKLTEQHTPPFRVVSHRPGYWQRSAGAFSFTLRDADNRIIFGSCWTAEKLWKLFKESKIEISYSMGDCELI